MACLQQKTDMYMVTLTAIEDGAFSEMVALKSIEIPSTVTSLGDYTCGGDYWLSNANILCAIDTLPNSMFANCGQLQQVTLPAALKRIGVQAFYDCRSLKSIEIPNSVQSIGSWAFNACDRLTYIEMPEQLQSIEQCAFQNCYGLKSVSLPSGLKQIGSGAFSNCGLTDVYFEGTEAQWSEIVIESGNESLTSATIHYSSVMPDSEKVEYNSDTYITPTIYGTLYWKENSMTWEHGSIAWEFQEDNETLVLRGTGKIPAMNPDCSIGWRKYALLAKHLIIENGITELGMQAFFTFRTLETAELPQGITAIGYGCFSDCNALKSIELPASLIQIDAAAFAGNYNLESIVIPDGVSYVLSWFYHKAILSSETHFNTAWSS